MEKIQHFYAEQLLFLYIYRKRPKLLWTCFSGKPKFFICMVQMISNARLVQKGETWMFRFWHIIYFWANISYNFNITSINRWWIYILKANQLICWSWLHNMVIRNVQNRYHGCETRRWMIKQNTVNEIRYYSTGNIRCCYSWLLQFVQRKCLYIISYVVKALGSITVPQRYTKMYILTCVV